MISVSIADNNPVVHAGINAFFNNNTDFKIVANFNTFADAKLSLAKKYLDVLVLDYELHGLESLTDLRKIISENPKTKFIVFTNLSENIYALNMIKIGISGYLSKNESLENLETAIEKVIKGEIYLNKKIQQKIENLKGRNKIDRVFKKISTREIEVLKYFTQGKKNKEIAEILNLDQKTISTYKLRLLAKLGVTNLVDLVQKAKTLDIM